MCTMNVSLECPMKQKDDEDASQATTFEEEEDKFSLSLSIFTSFFLSFLWTKFICTETAQRFSCKKKKSLLFSADYIISSKILLLLPLITSPSFFIPNLYTTKWHIHIISDRVLWLRGVDFQSSLPCLLTLLYYQHQKSSKEYDDDYVIMNVPDLFISKQREKKILLPLSIGLSVQ